MPLSVTIRAMREGHVVEELQFNSLTHRVIKIGALGSAHVKLVEPGISRVHAVIELSSSKAMLIDMGTGAGTLLNGTRAHRAELQNDDLIAIGGWHLHVMLDAGATQPASGAVAATPPVAAPPRPAPTPGVGQPQQQPQTAPGGPYPAPPPGPQAPVQPPYTPPPVPPPPPQPLPGPGLDGIDGRRRSLVAAVNALAPDKLAALEAFVAYLVSQAPSRSAAAARRRGGAGHRRLYALVGAGIVFAAALLAVLVTAALTDAGAPSAAAPAEAQVEVKSAPAPQSDPAAAQAEVKGAPAPRPDPSLVVLELGKTHSLESLATELWGSPAHAGLLLEHNPWAAAGAELAPGTRVAVPRSVAHTVIAGDSLGAIAGRLLGDPKLYAIIHAANQEILPDPSGLEIGMRLTVPLVPPPVVERLRTAGTIR